jgi:endoglucanase
LRKTTAAALDFAAVCAQAARVYKDFETEFPGFSDSCINAAFKAWKWARRFPNIQYIQSQLTNPAINTGAYGDENFSDEFHWAAMELYITTKLDSFYTRAGAMPTLNVPNWQDVKTLAYISLTLHKKNLTNIADTTTMKNRLLSQANVLRNRTNTSAYRIAMGDNDFYWGSNGGAANQGLILMSAFEITGDTSYLDAAVANLDYLLGRNGTNFCFVTGFGNVSPMNIHHAISGADGILNPVPGLLAGGPNLDAQHDCGAAAYPSSSLRALAYTDSYCSYSTNEVAINWNAPLTFVTMGIEAVLKGVRATPGTSVVTPTDIATIQEITSVQSASDIEKLADVFPNPAQTTITVQLASEMDNLTLMNSTGQPIENIQAVTAGQTTLNVSECKPGLYFLVIEKDGIVLTKKIMIQP